MQKHLVAPVKKIQSSIDELVFDGEQINFSALSFLGIFILRNFIRDSVIAKLKKELQKRESRTSAQPLHPTRVNISNPEQITKLLVDEAGLGHIFASGYFFNGNVAIDPPVLFRKDKLHNRSVILHNDIDYTSGFATKYSLFCALTTMKPENGGIQLYPGTHNFRSLGDAGELNPAVSLLNTPSSVLC